MELNPADRQITAAAARTPLGTSPSFDLLLSQLTESSFPSLHCRSFPPLNLDLPDLEFPLTSSYQIFPFFLVLPAHRSDSTYFLRYSRP